MEREAINVTEPAHPKEANIFDNSKSVLFIFVYHQNCTEAAKERS